MYRTARRSSNYSNMPAMLFEEYVPFELTTVEDTYAEVEIQMPIPRDRNQIPAIHAIEVLYTPKGEIEDSGSYSWHLAKRSKTAVSDLSDSDILFVGEFIVKLVATANGTSHLVYNGFERQEKKYPVASPHIKLFFGCLIDGFSSTKKITGRICYTMRYVSRADIMEALMD